jgi:hypothetical protein
MGHRSAPPYIMFEWTKKQNKIALFPRTFFGCATTIPYIVVYDLYATTVSLLHHHHPYNDESDSRWAMETKKEVVVELGRGEAAPLPRRVVAPRVELGFGGIHRCRL